MAQNPAKIPVKPASEEVEVQIARLMRWLENENQSQTFGAQLRMKAFAKFKHLPIDLIFGPAVKCMKKATDRTGNNDYEAYVRAAYASSQ